MTSGRFGGVSPVAPPLRGPALFDQDWRSVFFIHWAVDPSVIAPLLPRGVRPDTYDFHRYVLMI